MKRRGYVLLPIVLAISLVAVIAYLLNRTGSLEMNLAASHMQKQKARYAAEAGMHHALWKLKQNTSCTGYTNLTDVDFAKHKYSVTITPTSGSPVLIVSKGFLSGGEEYTITRQVPVYGASKTYVIQPGSSTSRDTFLREDKPGDTHHTKVTLHVGPIGQAEGMRRRTLIKFDTSALENQSLAIRNAVLSLNLKNINQQTTVNVGTHRLTKDWIVFDATWNVRKSTIPWTVPGGDFQTTADATTAVGPQLAWYNWDLKKLTEYWVKKQVSNDGVLLKPVAGTVNLEFGSSEGAVCADHPKLTITYACECGKVCSLASVGGQPCNANYSPLQKISEFSTLSIGANDVWGITFLPECMLFNGVLAPIGGAWILTDYGNDAFYMVSGAGALLTTRATPTANMKGIALIYAGLWTNHLAVTESTEAKVYLLDLLGTVQSSFSTSAFTTHPVGIAYIGTTASGSYNGHLAVTSDKNNAGASAPAVFIVDQAGAIKATLSTLPFSLEPWGVAHLSNTDKLLVADKSGSVYTIDFQGNLLGVYSTASFGVTQLQGFAIHPQNCQHALAEHDTQKVMFLGP